MYKRLRKNKKAEDMLVDFFVILGFALTLVIIFIVFWATKDKATDNNISDDFENKDASTMLNSFLKAPVSDTTTVSDIIAKESVSYDYKITSEVFKEFFKGLVYYQGNIEESYYHHYYIDCMELDINNVHTISLTLKYYNDQIQYMYKDSKCDFQKGSQKSQSVSVIPSFDNQKIVMTLNVFYIKIS
jgi:hypothetical protein